MFVADGRRHADHFAEHPERAHHADGRKRHVGRADVPPGQEKIFAVPRVQAPVRNGVRLTEAPVVGAGPERLAEFRLVGRIREMEVNVPRDRGGLVRVRDVIFQIVLRQHMVADRSVALAFSADRRDPVQLVVLEFGLSQRVVLHEIPV